MCRRIYILTNEFIFRNSKWVIFEWPVQYELLPLAFFLSEVFYILLKHYTLLYAVILILLVYEKNESWYINLVFRKGYINFETAQC